MSWYLTLNTEKSLLREKKENLVRVIISVYQHNQGKNNCHVWSKCRLWNAEDFDVCKYNYQGPS